MSDLHPTYEAYAFNPDLGNETVAGRLVIDRWQFHFEAETLRFDIPNTQVRARMGAGEDDRIYFWDTASPAWEIFTTDHAILENPHLTACRALREQLSADASQREVKRRLKQLAYVAGVCFLVILLGQIAVSAMVRSIVRRVPPSLEAKLGAEAMVEVRDELDLVNDPARVKHLATLAAPLTGSLRPAMTNFQFYIATAPEPNAFALPGGHVIVTTGMLNMCQRPEELLGVLAHELAHVTQKHGLRQVIASAGPFLIFRVFLGGSGGGLGGVIGGASDLLVSSGFSREYETEADEEGWRLLVAAKIDPSGMIETFEKLQAFERSQGSGFDLPEAFASHPALDKRLTRLRTKWQKLAPKDFANLSALNKELASAAKE